MSKRKKEKLQRHNINEEVRSYMGVAWYRREQWDRLLEVCSDRNEIENTYDEWLEMAEKNLKILTRQGYVFRKVDIDVEELISWCNSQIRSVDGDARTEFTMFKLRELKENKDYGL